ncbi:hypothetical protein C8R47DRAFT_144370 [Mycena vitilis]|nr:hypothetical protein C8R47DRAFT_144370 [Mycena vitilis]
MGTGEATYIPIRRVGPLDIPELLARCIVFLSDSATDLKACALVARSWVHAAQSRLFRAPTVIFHMFNPLLPWRRFCETLRESPHLVSHIRQLDMSHTKEYSPALETICGFPFPNLQKVSIFVGFPGVQNVRGVQHVLGLSTLRHVKLSARSIEPTDFAKMWERCSFNLQHLEIKYLPHSAAVIPSFPPSVARISLSSLRLDTSRPFRWTQRLCPFDLSQLNALSIGTGVEVQWREFAPAIQKIQIFAFVAQEFRQEIDLKAFPKLSHLRISVPQPVPPTVLTTLSTISHTHRIQAITISLTGHELDEPGCTRLARAISNLPMGNTPTLELEMDFEFLDEAAGIFAGFRPDNKPPSISLPDDVWWEHIIEGL